jgi:hypothetical protein
VFGRKPKPQPQDQGLDRRRMQRGNTPQAFSYYTSRVSEPRDPRKAKAARVKIPSKPLDAKEKPEKVSKQRTRSLLSGLPFWILILVAIVCAVKMLTLSTTPKIIVVGGANNASYVQPDSVYAAAAEKLLASSITNRSKLTVNTNGITESLKREFPELVDVSISIPLVSNRPVVYVQPAQPSLVLQSTSGNFAVNDTGFVLASLSAIPSNVPTVVDQSGIAPQPGKQLLSGDTVSFISTVLYQFTAAHLTISTFVLPVGNPYELDVHLAGKPYTIRFNLEQDTLTQSGTAIATIQQLGTTIPKDYIDVRVPGRVYYK